MGTKRTGHPRARDDVLFRQVDDEWVLFDPTTNELHVLNLPAALIWSHLAEGREPDEIRSALTDAYDIDADRARADLQGALVRFRRAGLLAGD